MLETRASSMTYTKDSELKGVSEWRVPNAPLPILFQQQVVANNDSKLVWLEPHGYTHRLKKEEDRRDKDKRNRARRAERRNRAQGGAQGRRRARGKPRKGDKEEKERRRTIRLCDSPRNRILTHI